MIARYRGVFGVLDRELTIHRFFNSAYIGQEMLDIRSPDADGQATEVLYQLPTLTIWLGASAAWASKRDGTSSMRFLMEGGCSLSITQQLDGSAVVTILPYQPQTGVRDTEKQVLILGVYCNPAKISKRKALRHLEALLAYAVSSSLYGAPTRSMRWTLARAKAGHWWQTKFHPGLVAQWISRTLPAVLKTVGAVAKAATGAVV